MDNPVQVMETNNIPRKVQLETNSTCNSANSTINLPYNKICHRRYLNAKVAQKNQFLKEIELEELLQNKGLDSVRIQRIFSDTVISKLNPKDAITLSSRQKSKIEEILKEQNFKQNK
ncbi:unnamed protein product [Phyllotreta striolata]|uniref:Uncharacterized protein n=1 Tax=Phyllotreta striolata TaxID=444603 RepID=A0A9N9TDP3_PHYSR|nr:unnamed protein product [Phyllotreta striolata]